LKAWGREPLGDGRLWQVTVFYPRRVEVIRCSSRREAEGVVESLLAVLERGEVERFSVKLQEGSPRRVEARLPGSVGAWSRC